jgi:hypothetical protein
VTCVLKVTPPPSGTTDPSTPRESGSHPVNSKSPKRCVSRCIPSGRRLLRGARPHRPIRAHSRCRRSRPCDCGRSGLELCRRLRPGSVGIVGLPTWMWVADPGQHTWGPITRTASSAGYGVTATAKVQRVVWAMGDGNTVTCTKRGTPYADSFGKRASPDCGYTYTRQGTYTVRATSYWRVIWAGIGQSGTIAAPLSSPWARPRC